MSGKEDEPVVVMEEVTKHYRQGATDVPALRRISLTVARASSPRCAVRRARQATALNLIARSTSPLRTIRIEGASSGARPRALSELRGIGIGFVFQPTTWCRC